MPISIAAKRNTVGNHLAEPIGVRKNRSAVLKCEECQRSSEAGLGWIALIVNDEQDPDWETYVVTYCPACAAREFEYRLRRG